MERHLKLVAVGNILIRDNKVLLLFRHNTGRKDNFYGFPGGMLDPQESVMQGAIREAREEIGIEIMPEDLELVHCVSSIENNIELIVFYFLVRSWNDEPVNAEPEKHSSLEWHSLNALPANLMERNKQVLTLISKGVRYSETGWNRGPLR